jgi:calcium-dependent protein kinase
MGCASSKDAVVETSKRNVPTSPTPATEQASIEKKGNLKESDVGTSLPESDGVGKGMLMDLNDVIPGSTPDSRGRFLSYASGASTPNTSDGNLSWEGIQDGDKDGQEKSSTDRMSEFAKKRVGSSIGLDEMDTNAAGLTSKVVHIEVPFGKPIEDVYDGIHSGPILGSGVSGLVRLITHRATGLRYAVKCLDIGLVGTEQGLAQLREEIFIMCQLDHPNIVRLEEVYESASEIYLVQELCLGGELFDRLDEQPDYHYTEAECARLIKQMLSSVRYLHSKGIIHRDLKLENFLFSSKAADSELKMIDFGLSKHFRFGEVHHEAVGTPYTVAPEVIEGSYDERCDIWAIGVITFLLLSGEPPFGGCGGPEPLLTVRSNILAGQYSFDPDEIWSLVSDKAKDCVKALLMVDPKSRPTAREAQKHPWFKEWASRQSKPSDKELNPNVVKALVNFKEFSDMRKLLSEVLSFTLLPHQIKDLRKEFEKMDTDGSGEISLSALKQVLLTNAGAGSLGALKEEEVEDIFDAMRVSKTETRIHWHEFIAAGLSQCQVDDRNLRLAFNRLDSDHKGVSSQKGEKDFLAFGSTHTMNLFRFQYISLDNIMNLVGSDELHSQEQIRVMWMESMKSVRCTQENITYEDFLLLMKGQTREPEPVVASARGPSLGPLPEGELLDEAELQKSAELPATEEKLPGALSPHLVNNHDPGLEENNTDDGSTRSLPNVGGSNTYDSSSSSLGLPSPASDSPASRPIISDIDANEQTIIPDVSVQMSPITRGRSKSLAEENESRDADDGLAQNNIALIVSRQLYRAHQKNQKMRISVLEASRRFEEEQARRARDTLIAQKLSQAGLVMRHGHKVQVTSEAIRKYLKENKAEQQELVEKANRRGGRGRSSRKKTISDLNAMLNPSLGPDEMGEIARKAHFHTPQPVKNMQGGLSGEALEVPDLRSKSSEQDVNPHEHKNAPMSTVVVGKKQSTVDVPSLELIDKAVRKATVPGEFRETKDPFSSDGMYGGSRINTIDVNAMRDKGNQSRPKSFGGESPDS